MSFCCLHIIEDIFSFGMAQLRIIFVTSVPKHMLWIFNRILQPKSCFQGMGKPELPLTTSE